MQFLRVDHDTISTSLAFISLFQADSSDLTAKPIGLCLAKVIGQNHEQIEICHLESFQLEKKRLISQLMRYRQTLPFDSIYADKETILYLQENNSWRDNTDPSNRPSLRAVVRSSDLVTRGMDALYEPLTIDLVVFARNVAKRDKPSILSLCGKSPEIDAMAGAVEQAKKLQKRIINNLIAERQMLEQAQGRTYGKYNLN